MSESKETKEKKEFQQKIRSLYFNSELRKKHKSFINILKAENIPTPEKIATKVKKNIEDSIKEVVDKISDIQYFIMEKTNYWGEYGQQRVIIGFARLKLNIAPEADITQRDINEFNFMMNQNTELKNLSVKRLKEIEDETYFKIFGKQVKVHRSDLVNRELMFCGSKNRICIGMYGKYRSIIYGLSKSMRKEGYELYLLEKEIARTPTNIMSIAAVIGEKDVGIRKESCRLIFEMKWKKMFEYTERDKAKMYNNEAGNIREMIKVRALEAYKVSSAEELEAKKELFIDEMVEGILWHEFGHGVFFNEELTQEQAGESKAFSYFGENIVGILHEVLADWAIRSKRLKGPIKHFLEIALKEKNPEKANRMLLVYMSDNWFLDFKEEFLGSQTDLMISILCPFLKDDSTFDFEAMDSKFDEIHDLMLNQSLEIIKSVLEIAEKAIYEIGPSRYHFDFIVENIDKFVTGDKLDENKESMLYKTAFWNNVFLLMEKIAKTDYAKVMTLFKTQDIQVKKALLKVLSPDKAPEYNEKIRDYLFDEMKAKGFYQKQEELTALDGIKMALDEIDVFEDEKESILKKFTDIYEGNETLNVKVDYDGGFDFFNCAIQEILISTQLGEINQEEIYRNDKVVIMQPGQDKAHTSSTVVAEKLDELAHKFNENEILSIASLKVNTEIEDIDQWYEQMSDTKLADESLLIQKVDHVTGEHMDNNIVFKVQIPVEYGYMCSSTVSAIERINSILRDSDKDKRLVDKTFIDYITYEYNNTY